MSDNRSRSPIRVNPLTTRRQAGSLPERQWLMVSSSNLALVMFIPNDPRTNAGNQLWIEFHGGRTYVYYRVPRDVWVRLMSAGSKGKFHARYIKWNYDFIRQG